MWDGTLLASEADWARELRHLISSHLGYRCSALRLGDYPEPMRPFHEDLAESAWSEVSEHRIPFTRLWTFEAVLNRLRSMPFAVAELLLGRYAAFEEKARALLAGLADGGSLTEEATFTVLLARRPARRCGPR